MDQQVRRELKDLCLNILRDDEPRTIADHLTQVQMLYEKLLVLNYLDEEKKKTGSAKPGSAMNQEDLPEITPEKESAQSHKPEKKIPPRYPEPGAFKEQREREKEERKEATPPPINESPVNERELKDDKTPEQMGSDSALGPKEKSTSPHSASINDSFNKGVIKVGLNDRIAFVKHLFGGSQEDFNRVLSQVNTFENYEEAENFIENMIKPDYNWSQKEEYELRFMDLVRSKFGVD